MKPTEIRYRVTSALLQAAGPLPLAELAERCRLANDAVLSALDALIEQGQVVAGELIEGRSGPHYRWATLWETEATDNAASARRRLRAITNPPRKLAASQLGIESKTIRAFHDFIIRDYQPSRDKRLLVFFQCSVRRPFSTSPSHASMRRAVQMATGLDPAKDFEACPVHVVVLASTIGPVPYELEDVYPANVGGGGVKGFSPAHYERVKPILARRMADYVTAHGGCYDHIATFTQGRYAEVVRAAQQIAGVTFPIFPEDNGPKVVRIGESTPRTYWQKYWIQLALLLAHRLGSSARRQMRRRLRERLIEYAD